MLFRSSEVQQLCSRVIILNEGRMALDYSSSCPQDDMVRIRVEIAGDGSRDNGSTAGPVPERGRRRGDGSGFPAAGGIRNAGTDDEGRTGNAGRSVFKG